MSDRSRRTTVCHRSQAVRSDVSARRWAASEAIATPFDTDRLTIVVSSVYKDFDDDVEVEWCYARNGSGDDDVNVPDDLLEQNSSVILAEVSYDYQAAFSVILNASYQLSDEFYLRPRRSVRVNCEDCDC